MEHFMNIGWEKILSLGYFPIGKLGLMETRTPIQAFSTSEDGQTIIEKMAREAIIKRNGKGFEYDEVAIDSFGDSNWFSEDKRILYES